MKTMYVRTIYSLILGALWLVLSTCVFAQVNKTAGIKGGSPAAEVTVPLGKSLGELTFSKTGFLTYKGKPFNPAVKVNPDAVQSFRISYSKDGRFAGAIAEDGDGQNSGFLLDLGALASTPLQKAGQWSGAQKVFWSPSGRYMLALCAYEGQRFVSVDLKTKNVVEGDFLGPEGKLWGIVDEPHWTSEPDVLVFTVNETCNPFDEANCNPERVLAKYSVSLNPATLKATSKKLK